MRRGLVMVLVAVFLVGGCTSKSAAPPIATPIPHAKTFASRDLRFSVSYDASRLVDSISSSYSGLAGNWLVVYFTDGDTRGRPSTRPYGPNGGLGIDAEEVMLPEPSLSAARVSLSTDYTAVGAPPGTTVFMMKQQFAHFTVGAVEPITLNGLSGYRIHYSWTGGSAETYELYKLLDHTPYGYTLTLTLSGKARPAYRQALDAALQSFAVTR